MPFKRKRVTKIKRSRKMRKATKVTRMSRSRASRSLNVHSFSRYAGDNTASIVTISTLQLSNNHVFTFNQLINFAEFANLFDQYMITKVIVTYQLITNPDASNVLNLAGNNPTPTNWFPTVWSITDYDDNSSENISQLKERIGVRNRILMPNKKLKYVVRPKMLVQTYRTATTTGYAPRRMFVDMSATDIPHYGLKTCFDTGGQDPSDTYPFLVKQEFKYYFTCRNVR